MAKSLHALIIEDSEDDALLLADALRRGGFDLVFERVETAEAMRRALADKRWDIILSDYVMPAFSAPAALELLRASELDLPFIIVSGTIGEDVAVKALKQGADDYLLKQNLTRLIPAIERSLEDAANRRRRRATEQALRQSAEQSRAMFELASIGMAQADPRTGQWLRVNDKMCAITGYSAEEMLKLRVHDITHPDDRAADLAAFQRIARGEAADCRLEKRYVRKDGRLAWVSVNVAAIRDAAGQPVRTIATIEDITERKHAEEQLRQLSRAVEQSPVSIIITNLAGNIEFVNPKFTQITGYSREEVLGQNPRFLKSGELTAEEYRQLWETISAGQEWRGQFHNKRKDGTLFWENASISPIRNDAGQITHFLAVKEDITEKRLLESKFLRAQRLEGIGSLASGIAHDLNNILAPIMMCVPLLREEMPAAEREQLTATIEASAQRAVEIVKQLLTLGRGKEGVKVPLQIRHLLREMGKIVQETFPRSIRVAQNYAKDLWTVVGDATQLHQVLLNLCVNARDAMPKGGHLTLSAENLLLDASYVSMHREAAVGPYVRIRVADTGSGIPDAVRQRIFDPFFTTKAPDQGTGLGLTTVLGIVKNHGGFIILHSTPGEGTVFDVYLPATPDARTQVEVERQRDHLPRGAGQVVLVVDDEHVIREAVGQMLRLHGYEVLQATDGVEALHQFTNAAGRIAAVVTDLMMPHMDGLTLCRTLRRLSPGTPLIISTGAASGQGAQEIAKTIAELNIRHILQKPHTADALLNALHQVLLEAPA